MTDKDLIRELESTLNSAVGVIAGLNVLVEAFAGRKSITAETMVERIDSVLALARTASASVTIRDEGIDG